MFDRVRTFFAQRKRSLAVFGAVFALLTLVTAPSVVIHAYSQSVATGEPWNMAFGRGVVALFAISLLWFVHMAMLFGMWHYMVPKLTADARGIRNGVTSAARAMPEAWRATRERISKVPDGIRSAWALCGRTLGRILSGIGTAFATIASLPSRWRAMSSGDKFASVGMGFSMLMVLGLGYWNWDLASRLSAKLPEWMQLWHAFTTTLYIDMVITMLMWALIFPILATLLRIVVKLIKNR
jgi:hypothetical protein